MFPEVVTLHRFTNANRPLPIKQEYCGDQKEHHYKIEYYRGNTLKVANIEYYTRNDTESCKGSNCILGLVYTGQ